MSGRRYEVTRGCNAQSKHWRGLLRDYAVTGDARMCMCAGAGMHERAPRNHVTA